MALIAAAPVRIALAHDDHERPRPPKRDLRQMYAPSEMPDRIVLTWTGDPATTQAVTWRTSDKIEFGLAEIATLTAGPGFRKHTRKVEATSEPFESDLSKCRMHTVEFTKLEPDTKYVYRVGDGVNWSEWFHFHTASDKPAPFSFVYFGDAQNEIRSMWSRIVREAYSDAPKAAFMLHAGDLVDGPYHDDQWGEWFGAGAWLNAQIPVVATPGNHEYRLARVNGHHPPPGLTPAWRPQFAFPMNGPEGLKETAYYFDYQGVRMISLNSNEKRELQKEWLDRVLSESRQKWNILTFHHPICPMAKQRGKSETRLWMDVIDQHGVDLVLTGHDHTYGRSDLVTHEENAPDGVNWRSDKGGTVYVVSVSGPKMYNVDDGARALMGKTGENLQLYQVITVDGDTLQYEARTADGMIYDAFSLRKGPDGKNEMRKGVAGRHVTVRAR